MDTFSLVYVGIMTGVNLYFLARVFRREVHPVATTWFLFVLGSGMTLATSLKHGGTISGNIANIFDVPYTWSGFLAVYYCQKKDGKLEVRIFDFWCIGATILISLWWFYTQEHAAANKALQIVMSVAYLPTFAFLWTAKENTESYVQWVIIFLLCGTATYLAYFSRVPGDEFSYWYVLRATTMVGILLGLMLRLDIRAKRNAHS